MKILFPIGSFYPSHKDGPSNSIYWLAKELRKRGEEITVVTTDLGINSKDISLNTYLDTSSGKVIYCKTKFHYLPIKLFIEVFRNIKHVDLIHLTALFYPGSWFSAIVGLCYRKKIVWSVRGELNNYALNSGSWFKRSFFYLFQLFLNQKRVVFHATSEIEAKFIEHHFKKSTITTVPNLFEIPTLQDANYFASNYFLYVGRIHPIKNIENIIKALSINKEFRDRNLFLIIAGYGNKSYIEFLQRKVENLNMSAKVQFIGEVVGSEKYNLYRNAIATFLVSHSENFGNVVIESMSQKTFVITSLGTPWQCLKAQNAGFWIANTSKSISETVTDILNMSNSEYNQIRKNAYKLVYTDFDITTKVADWITIYSNLLKRNF